MENLQLFTDGSVNIQTKIGFGAYLAVENTASDNLSSNIKTKKFFNTSSTKLELQTLIWALTDLCEEYGNIMIYTDSQNIIRLPDSRIKLEETGYYAKNKKLLNHHELYRQFFALTDKLNCVFVKMKGHKISSEKTDLDKRFALVDKASRTALKEDKLIKLPLKKN